MPERPATSVVLACFEPAVAMAVVEVLRRRRLPAWTAADASQVVPGSGAMPGEAAVLVPVDRRDEALTVLAAAMEEVAAGRQDPGGVDRRDGELADAEDAGEYRPLVFERLRRFGGLALLLVPLLILTLQAPPVSVRYGVLVLVGGLVVLVALRDRWRS